MSYVYGYSHSYNMRLLQRWNQTAIHNKALVLTSVLVAFGTLFYAAAAVLQVYIMREAARSSSEQTARLIEAANKNAAAAKSFSNTATSVDARIKDAEADFRRLSRSTEESLKATQNSFRADQRAWVGVGDYSTPQLDPKEPFKFDIPLLNTGKTPAIRAERAVAYQISPTLISEIPQNYNFIFEPAGAVPPQGHIVITITNSAVPPYYESLLREKMFLYFYGELRYHDVNTPVLHHTRFCLMYVQRAKRMQFCLFGNEMD